MISDAALLEAVEQGVTVAQLVAMILADRNATRAKRAMRKAARLGESITQGGHVESGLRVVSRTQSASVAQPASAEGLEHPRVKLAVARKAVPLLKVTDNAKQVLAALLDFCNAETLRCYPGLDHIALKLGRSGQEDPRRHIRRGIAGLVAAGVLKVAAHAGLRHANAYFPQWDRLAAIVRAFETGEGVEQAVRVQSDSPDRIVPQTQKKNPTSVTVRRVQRANQPDRRQRELMLPVVLDGGRGSGAAVPAAIAREHASVRLGTAYRERLHQLGEAAGRELKGSVTAEDWEAGVVAEMARRGSGLQAMLDAGFTRWSAETKPPSAATG